MTKEYDIYICKCGRIHAIYDNKHPKERVTPDEKDLALICSNCGTVMVIGAELCSNGYNLYTYIKKFETPGAIMGMNKIATAKPTEVYYSVGYPVPMKTGNYANRFSETSDRFYDMEYPMLSEIDRHNITYKDVHEFVNNFYKNSSTVDMERFMRETPKDVLASIACYGFRAFKWEGTPYENIY